MKPSVAVALSGGIDSLVAAHLLVEAGHSVIGIHFLSGYEKTSFSNQNKTGFPKSNAKTRPVKGYPTASDLPFCKTKHIADQLGISVELLDCTRAFQKIVVDYFARSYQAGKTPNPCLVCNPKIKFGLLLERAQQLGAVSLATGHYARIQRETCGKFHLLQGKDRKKDQSYFLTFLSQFQLSRACFPLGEMTKVEVRRLAQRIGLTPFTALESQDICFIQNTNYAAFLAKQQGFRSFPGLIEDVNGNILGKHEGLHLFTVGQRRGINCPAREPYYVVRLDIERNRLVVGSRQDLLADSCRVSGINWIGKKPAGPIQVETRLRYRHRAVASTLHPIEDDSGIVRFDTPQAAVTPGQGAVFYRKDRVLGGGWIELNSSTL
jgi:tRNA-specific 2-thiouridylase